MALVDVVSTSAIAEVVSENASMALAESAFCVALLSTFVVVVVAPG